MLRRHLVTGNVALYLAMPERCREPSRPDANTSRRIVAALYHHSIRSFLSNRYVWNAGDIVI